MTTTRATDGSAFWKIVTSNNDCEIVDGGRCVTDGPGNYGNNEHCEVFALRPLHVTAEYYHIEKSNDYVTINDIQFKRSRPIAVFMNEGNIWSWDSDSTITRQGYKLCANTTEVQPNSMS